MPLLMCLNKEEANYVLQEMHERICECHVVGTSIALKALRNGYFWPTIKANALNLIRCNKCQRYAHVPRKPFVEQLPLVVTYPFDQWGVDLLDPFPIIPSQLKYLIAAIEYLTKWIEAEPLVTLTVRNVQKFVYKSIAYRLGMPNVLVQDNGIQVYANSV